MAARYIPPGRRNAGGLREQRVTSAAVEASTGTPEPTRDLSPKSFSAGDICNYFGGESTGSFHNSSTLHASAASPDSLAFVLLFHGANPRWPTDHILFVKSNLDLLRADTEEHSDTTVDRKLPESVAVFEQTRGSRSAKFEFAGWYKVVHVQFLSPRTTDLVRMLEQKWTKKDRYGNVSQIEREGDAWSRSLNQRWAVVKFEKDDVAGKEKGNLEIPGKSVNELLQEMRLKGTAVVAAEGATAEDGSQTIAILKEQDPSVSHGHSNEGQSSSAKGCLAPEATKTLKDSGSTEDATASMSSSEVC